MTSPSADDVERLGELIGHRFTDPASLATALTHRSYSSEHPGVEHYERLEFLGDAVLELAVTRYLFDRFPEAPEGQMAKVRASVVAEPVLAAMARRFGLQRLVGLGRGEDQTGGREKDSILSDVVEAVLAVIYLEAGFPTAEQVVHHHWGPLIDDRAIEPGRRDYKTRLQETLAREGRVPVYRSSEQGPQHAKTFTAEVAVGDEMLGTGHGTSKKRAEQEAARAALTVLDGLDA